MRKTKIFRICSSKIYQKMLSFDKVKGEREITQGTCHFSSVLSLSAKLLIEVKQIY